FGRAFRDVLRCTLGRVLSSGPDREGARRRPTPPPPPGISEADCSEAGGRAVAAATLLRADCPFGRAPRRQRWRRGPAATPPTRIEAPMKTAFLDPHAGAETVTSHRERGRSESPAQVAPEAPSRPGILVVDDEAFTRVTLDAELRQHGFAVWLARD